jgi:hypothetical protein
MNSDESAIETDEHSLAMQRLEKRRDFNGRVAAYLVVNGALWILWAFTGSGYPWPAWITGLLGIGLVLKAWDVYFRRPIRETDVLREIARLHARAVVLTVIHLS